MSNGKCQINDCDLKTFNDNQECILHCQKRDYSHDFWHLGTLSRFYKELINYILNQISSYSRANTSDLSAIKDYLSDDVTSFSSSQILSVEHFLTDVIFNRIYFPARKSQDHFDYLKVLNKLKGIHFNYCEFQAHSLSLSQTKVFFQDCQFHTWWSSDAYQILGNVNNVIYQDCTFHGNVDFSSEFNQRDKDENAASIALFNDCWFKGKLSLRSLNLSQKLFNNSNEQELHPISELNIVNCTIDSRFTLENCSIGTFSMRNTHFNERFKGKNNRIGKLLISNCNFNKLFDFYGSNLTTLKVEQTIFEDFVGFEKCVFSQNSNDELSDIAVFNYVTFLSFTNFRNTVFYQGLNIENINFKEVPNFLNIQLKSNRSNRETFRIIKHSFDKIGNHIEANKFYAKEMEKHYENLKQRPFWSQERLILGVNKCVSNFGQSYLRPITLTVITAICFYFIQLGYERNWLYVFSPSTNTYISNIAEWFNNVARNIPPFSRFLIKGIEFVSLIFYIIFASFIWQTVIAIKRHTKR